MAAGDHWALDKRIPLAVVLTVAVQTAGLVWWAASLTAASHEHERRIATVERTIEIVSEVKSMGRDLASAQIRLSDVTGAIAGLTARQAGADAERAALRASVDRLERQIDRMVRREGSAMSAPQSRLGPVIDGDASIERSVIPGAGAH